MKSDADHFQGHYRAVCQFPTPHKTYVESKYRKILLQTGNTASNRISFKVLKFSNIFSGNAPATDLRRPVKSNIFILVLNDLEAAALQYILKVIRCLCKTN